MYLLLSLILCILTINNKKSMKHNQLNTGYYSYNFTQVFLFLILIRAVQFLVVYFTPFQFDTSSSILIDKYKSIEPRYPQFIITILNNLVSWDSVYILKLSIEEIAFEHEWVFGPLWWRLMSTFLKLPLLKHIKLDIYDILIIFIVINNLLLLATSKIIYKLTYTVCNRNLKHLPKGFNISVCAFYSSFVLIIQPSGIFSTVAYTETPVQFLCFLALYFFSISKSRVNIRNKLFYFLSGSLFSIAFGIRSNSLLYGILYLYDITVYYKYPLDIIVILTTGSQLFFALIYFNYVSYKTYCPERGEWCNSFTRSLVTYAQSHYWNNGFLNYFTLGNLPLFIIALPQLYIIFISIWNLRKWDSIKSILLVSTIYLFLQFTSMHVQIVNRVSTFIPIHLIYVSYLLSIPGENSKSGKKIIRWWVVWILVQTALFSAFLPPA